MLMQQRIHREARRDRLRIDGRVLGGKRERAPGVGERQLGPELVGDHRLTSGMSSSSG